MMELPLNDDFFEKLMSLQDSTSPDETPDPNSCPDHATSIEKEQIGDNDSHSPSLDRTSMEHEHMGDNNPDSNSRQNDLSVPGEANKSPVETPSSNSCPNHATPMDPEQVGDSNDHSQTLREDHPVPQDGGLNDKTTTSDSHHTGAPSPSSEPVLTSNEIHSQDTPFDDEDSMFVPEDEDSMFVPEDEDSMFVPENFHDSHSVHDDQPDSNVWVDNAEPQSQATEGASEIPMHDFSHNGHAPSQGSSNLEPNPQQNSYNAAEAYGPPQPHGSQAYTAPFVYEHSQHEVQLLEAEYQTVLKGIAALKARKSALEEQPITAEANAEMGGIDQEMMSLRIKGAQLSESFKALGLDVPFSNPKQPAKFTGLRKGQTVHSSEEYWARRNKNNEKDISKKRKVLEQETESGEKVTSKKPKTKPRIFDRMQDGSDLAKKGATHSLGKLRFENPTQARMVRDSVAGALENEPEDDQAESQKTFLEIMHPEVFTPDQPTLFKCAASFGEGNCVKLANGNYRIKGCTEPVRPHQMCGASWQNEKEFSEDKGGIIANEQGTGKTYQAIINMLTHPPSKKALDEGRKATLIIVPSNVLQQWQMELARFTTEPSFAAYKEGTGKFDNSRTWKALDVIFVSHDQFRRAYFSTAVLKQYEDKECDEDTKAQLRLDYLGFLFHNKWWRVIIDEAHAIKNYDTKLFKACRELDSEHRWCLTGTPFPNGTLELWAYLEFLGVSWRGSHKNFIKLLDNLHLAKNKKKFQAWMGEIMQRRTMGQKFAGEHLYEIPECFEEVITIPFSKEEEIIYRRIEHRLRENWNKSMQAMAIHNQKLAANSKKTKGQKSQAADQKEQKEMKLCLISLIRLKSATMHPFLLEATLRDACYEEDFDHILSALHRLPGHEPVVEQLKHHFNRLRQRDYVSDIGEMSNLESFGRSGYGGPLEMEKFIARSKAAKFQTSCVLCLSELIDCQRPKCGHVCCRHCLETEFVMASGVGDGIPKCIVCRNPVEELESIGGHNSGMKTEAEEEMEDLRNFRAAKKRANGCRRVPAEEVEGRNGKKLGDDWYGRQPRPLESNTAWLAAADLAYPTPLHPSAKTTVIKQLVLNCQKNHPADKIIIFSQFQETHQIIGRMLQDEGIGFAYFWGQLGSEQKDTVIRDFHENPNMRVLVASLKCGGVGLNITCANRVIITEPWWNAAIELQANARVFRMGQMKTTHFTTLLMKNSIDMRLRSLQSDKLDNIESALKYSRPMKEEMASLLGRVIEDRDGNLFVEEDYVE